MSGRVRVFLAVSVDGFIAGENDDLSWLPPPVEGAGDGGFAAFLASVGSLLMGRRTYDVLEALPEAPWPYGDRPVWVATHRPLSAGRLHVRGVSGDIATMLAVARESAGGQDVYVDGGQMVRQALDAGLVDELILTIIPKVLGRGISLFTGLSRPLELELMRSEVLPGGWVQQTYRPR